MAAQLTFIVVIAKGIRIFLEVSVEIQAERSRKAGGGGRRPVLARHMGDEPGFVFQSKR